MRIKSLQIKNFLSFGDRSQELLFAKDTDISFIVGPNNSGKSNLFRTLNFVAEAIGGGYLPFDPDPYLAPGRRDFEIAVGIVLDDDEIQALQDLLTCGNMLYNPGGPPETQQLMQAKNDILAKHGDAIFAGLQKSVSMVVKGTVRKSSPINYTIKVVFGNEEFLVTRDSYLAKIEPSDRGSFGYIDFGAVLIEDLKQRYLASTGKASQPGVTIDSTYEPPRIEELLTTRLVTETAKAGHSPFAGVQIQPLNFVEFDQRVGTVPQLQRLRSFLDSRGLKGDMITLSGFFGMLYASSFVWVPDLRGRPPDNDIVVWEKTVERQGLPQYLGPTGKPKIALIAANELPARLFELLTSSDASGNRRYEAIRREFEKFTDGMSFRVYLGEREVTDRPELSVVKISPEQIGMGQGLSPVPASAVLGIETDERRKTVKVAALQMLDRDASWPIGFASAGTIEVLSLLTAIIGTRERILLLDEPAQNMHPDFQERFLNLLRLHAGENGNQVVVVTHSPFLLARDDLARTWRLNRKKEGDGAMAQTVVLSVMGALSGLDERSAKKIAQHLDSTDVRSLFFSRGAVFVEGLSDKWVVEEIDRKMSLAGRGANLVENEWTVVYMGSKDSTRTFLRLAELLGLRYAFLLDGDAGPIVQEILSARGYHDADQNTIHEAGFFLLKTDLDDILSIVGGSNKPLKALDKVLAMRDEDVPAELIDFEALLKERIGKA